MYKTMWARENLRQELARGELLDGGETGHPLLVDESSDSDHSEAAVLNLGKLVLGVGSGVLAQAQRVECVLSRLARGIQCEHLDEGWDANDALEEGNPEEKLDHGALGDTPGVDFRG